MKSVDTIINFGCFGFLISLFACLASSCTRDKIPEVGDYKVKDISAVCVVKTHSCHDGSKVEFHVPDDLCSKLQAMPSLWGQYLYVDADGEIGNRGCPNHCAAPVGD